MAPPRRLFLPLIRLMVPELVDIHLPADSVFHNFAIASIRKRYPGQARKVMHAIWGLGQLMFSKFVIIVDEDVDVQNLREVLGGSATIPIRRAMWKLQKDRRTLWNMLHQSRISVGRSELTRRPRCLPKVTTVNGRRTS